MNTRTLYELTLEYPWKSLLRGIYGLAVLSVIMVIAIPAWAYFVNHSATRTEFVNAVIIVVSIAFVLTLVMRYLLIHVDKIQAPIKVSIKEDVIRWEKGERGIEFPLAPISKLQFLITDKMMRVSADLKERVPGVGVWWRFSFRVHNEFDKKDDYRRFLEEIYPEFKEKLSERVKYLNPNVKIIEKDERRKIKY